MQLRCIVCIKPRSVGDFRCHWIPIHVTDMIIPEILFISDVALLYRLHAAYITDVLYTGFVNNYRRDTGLFVGENAGWQHTSPAGNATTRPIGHYVFLIDTCRTMNSRLGCAYMSIIDFIHFCQTWMYEFFCTSEQHFQTQVDQFKICFL